jgi:hypothetical protein
MMSDKMLGFRDYRSNLRPSSIFFDLGVCEKVTPWHPRYESFHGKMHHPFFCQTLKSRERALSGRSQCRAAASPPSRLTFWRNRFGQYRVSRPDLE